MGVSVRVWAALIAVAVCSSSVAASAQQKPHPSPEAVASLGQDILKRYREWGELQDRTGAALAANAPDVRTDRCDNDCVQRAAAETNAKAAEAFNLVRDTVTKYGWVAPPVWPGEVETTSVTILSLRLVNLRKSAAMDEDVAFVKPLLPVLRERIAAKAMGPTLYSSMVDAIELYEGRRQIYGSRFECVGGKYAPVSVLEPWALNERRASLGLGPIEDHELSKNKAMQAYCAQKQTTVIAPL
jgi:hypothetical protein